MSILQITAFALNALGLILSLLLWKRQKKLTKIISEQKELLGYKTQLIRENNEEKIILRKYMTQYKEKYIEVMLILTANNIKPNRK